MGALHAQEYATQVALKDIELEQAIIYHFAANHYPPLPMSLVPVAMRIIKGKCKGERVRLPEGVTYRGSTTAPIGACIENWHLEFFMQND